jgi:glycosyltransferase involved in cell wall biosynthesis
MRAKVLLRGVNLKKIEIVSNWVDTDSISPLSSDDSLRASWGLNGRFVVMYSGNLGLTQNLESILFAAREMQQDPAEFVFVGEGAMKATLQRRAQDWSLSNVRFLPYQPKGKLGESLSAADLHLLPLQRGLAGYIVPSKLYGILAAGKPYLAAVDADSDVARIATESRSGLVIAPDSPGELIASIRWCMNHERELVAMGDRGRRYAEAHCDRSIAVRRFTNLLHDVAEANT